MKLKEQGWVLSVDQASNQAGISLWMNGGLVAFTVLKATKSTDVFSKRLQDQVAQLETFLEEHLPKDVTITKVIFEGVRARLVTIVIGALLTNKRIQTKMHQQKSFIEAISWKKYAQKRGATADFKDIKGVQALREIGFPMENITSDDVADSILIYLTWREKD